MPSSSMASPFQTRPSMVKRKPICSVQQVTRALRSHSATASCGAKPDTGTQRSASSKGSLSTQKSTWTFEETAGGMGSSETTSVAAQARSAPRPRMPARVAGTAPSSTSTDSTPSRTTRSIQAASV